MEHRDEHKEATSRRGNIMPNIFIRFPTSFIAPTII
jgi:hypothetical protein